MSTAIFAMSAGQSIQLAFVAFALTGLVAFAIHHNISKRNKNNDTSDNNQRFDSTGTWMFLAIITIPFGVILWVALMAMANAWWFD